MEQAGLVLGLSPAVIWDKLAALADKHVGTGAIVAAMMLSNAALGAVIAYFVDPAQAGRRSFRGLLAYCFPPRVLLHRSAVMDYCYAIAHRMLYPILIVPAITAAVFLGHLAWGLAEKTFGPPVHHGENWIASFAFTMIALVLLRDFWLFFFHTLEHRVWWLWEFHKTHHAAEAMPWGLTARRNHPVDEILNTFVGTAIPGIVFGIFAYAVNADVDEVLVGGISIFYIIECFGFRHLKHSHIHLRFPLWLEKILISPAQHHLHHSVEARHWGKNYSTLFAFWDTLFGTWHRSEPEPNFRIGLPDGESRAFNRSVFHLYLLPFRNVRREWRRRRETALQPARAAAGAD